MQTNLQRVLPNTNDLKYESPAGPMAVAITHGKNANESLTVYLFIRVEYYSVKYTPI